MQLIQIQPVNFPLNLGTADSFYVNISKTGDNTRGGVFFSLFDTTNYTRKRLTSGFLRLTEDQISAHGNDLNWAKNYVVEQLGLTLIS